MSFDPILTGAIGVLLGLLIGFLLGFMARPKAKVILKPVVAPQPRDSRGHFMKPTLPDSL